MSIEVVWPSGAMALLTQLEADSISHTSRGELYQLYRNCSLAVLNSGNETDNSQELLEHFETFDLNVIRNERGLKIELINPPPSAFVDGRIIKSLKNHLYAVLRDIVQIHLNRDYMRSIINNFKHEELSESDLITNGIFIILRNANCFPTGKSDHIAVCWGGHAIPRREYDYAYDVGYALGLRRINICTGCGPGIMEAPMKGSIMGHALQCAADKCRLIGLTEPSIIAAEPPNSMVSDLVILPDIEKRLEAFVRLGHCLIVFPGGPGTAEELLYILAIKLSPENRHTPLPLVLTGGADSRPYFEALERFLIACFGEGIRRCYRLIIDDPDLVATTVKSAMDSIIDHRTLLHDSYCFNWTLRIPAELQHPLVISHEAMAALNLRHSQEPWQLAVQLRTAFSGIVAGNVKEAGVKLVASRGPFSLHGDRDIIEHMAELTDAFIKQGRILLSQRAYKPCYTFTPDAPQER